MNCKHFREKYPYRNSMAAFDKLLIIPSTVNRNENLEFINRNTELKDLVWQLFLFTNCSKKIYIDTDKREVNTREPLPASQ